MKPSSSVSFHTSVTFRTRVVSAEAVLATTTDAASVAVAAAAVVAKVKSNKWLLKTKLYKTVFSNVVNWIIEEIPPIVKC